MSPKNIQDLQIRIHGMGVSGPQVSPQSGKVGPPAISFAALPL